MQRAQRIHPDLRCLGRCDVVAINCRLSSTISYPSQIIMLFLDAATEMYQIYSNADNEVVDSV